MKVKIRAAFRFVIYRWGIADGCPVVQIGVQEKQNPRSSILSVTVALLLELYAAKPLKELLVLPF